MDLVHIVYKSLIYFGILAVLVIIISYVSYKVRRKVTGQKFAYEEEIEKQKEKAKKVAEQKAKREKEKAAKEAAAKRPVDHTKAKKHVEVKKRLKEEPKEQKREKIRKRSITKTFTRKKRLEIINPSVSPYPNAQESKPASGGNYVPPPVQTPRIRKSEDSLPAKKKKLHSLDENVFEKYADDNEDDGMFTIKVKKSDD